MKHLIAVGLAWTIIFARAQTNNAPTPPTPSPAQIAAELAGKASAPGSSAAPAVVSPGTSGQTLFLNDVALPSDMQQLIARIRKCTEVWEREPQPNRRPQPGEADRLEKYQKSLRQSKCSSISRALISMRQKYKDQPAIVKICDKLISQPPEKYGAILKGP